MIHIFSLSNMKIISYMWSPNAKNMVEKDLLWELQQMITTAFLKEEITLAVLIGESDLFGNKGGCIAFPLSHQKFLFGRELTQDINLH